MSLTWIVTSGNSDVILTADSKQSWLSLRTQKNNQLYPCENDFNESCLVPGYDDRFTLPARVLGILYGDTWDTHNEYFKFPLLEEFTQKLKKENKCPDRIIVLLTNQKKIFSEDSEDPQYDRCKDSPYWRDTCELESIFRNYFDREFGKGKVQFIYLIPETRNEGLDNWDSALDLVQKQFKKQIKAEKDDRFIVSHQAGTPAISSAVQFASLSRFNNVTFLIGNERDKDLTRFLGSSSYLRGIEIQQAKKLLENYDYSGMKEVLKKQIEELKSKEKPKLEDEILKHISYLLDIAIQWNFAKFEDFAQKLSSYSEQNLVKQKQGYLQDVALAQTYLKNAERAKAYLQNKDQYWWWTAYESAYLGLIRLEQQNIVEAFFHTFRAMEGLVGFWSADFYRDDIENRNGKIFAKFRNPSKLPQYLFQELEKLHQEDNKDEKGLFGDSLFKLFRESRPDLRDNQDLKTIWKSARGMRNSQFHQLMGFKDEKAMFQAWGMSSRTSWEKRLLNCLNLIANQPQFKSIKDASLMAQVHHELTKAIVSL